MKTFALAVVSFLLCFFILSSLGVGFTYSEKLYMSMVSGGFYVFLTSVGDFLKR